MYTVAQMSFVSWCFIKPYCQSLYIMAHMSFVSWCFFKPIVKVCIYIMAHMSSFLVFFILPESDTEDLTSHVDTPTTDATTGKLVYRCNEMKCEYMCSTTSELTVHRKSEHSKASRNGGR